MSQIAKRIRQPALPSDTRNPHTNLNRFVQKRLVLGVGCKQRREARGHGSLHGLGGGGQRLDQRGHDGADFAVFVVQMTRQGTWIRLTWVRWDSTAAYIKKPLLAAPTSRSDKDHARL